MTASFRRFILALGISLSFAGLALPAAAQGAPIGIVVMHGKGGSPTKHVADLAAALKDQGLLVANLEMPWSGRREYDVPVSQAVTEVELALATLREQGAQKLFVAGHSQGGLFTLYLGGQLKVDGLIAMAPGGSAGSKVYREKLADAMTEARRLVAEGKGHEKARLMDYESARGTYPIVVAPAIYLSWFDPAGAMNQSTALNKLNPAIPVLLIVPPRDYPGLLRLKQETAAALPRHPQTRLYEPDATHLEAPTASAPEIIRWIRAVAGGR